MNIRVSHPIFLLLLLFIGNESSLGQVSNSNAIIKSEFIFSAKDSLWRSHVSNPVETKNGLIVAFRALKGYKGEFGVWVCHYRNGSWYSPVEVVAPTGTENRRTIYLEPVLQNWPDGSIKLFYKERTPDGERFGMYKTSYDSGKTWSDGQRFQTNIYGPVKNKPRILNDGTIISPSQAAILRPELEGTERMKFNIHFEKSADSGITWRRINPPRLETDNQVNTLEPCILIHSSDTLQSLCRSNAGSIFETWSYDNGDSWSALKATSLPNSDAGFDALTLLDNRYLLVYNHTSVNGDRSMLNVAISIDGIKWEAALIIENDDQKEEEFAYPSIIQTSDGLIHMTYSWNLLNIKHVVIDPDELRTMPIIDGKWPGQI
jgi:alpha-L-rhamnosidase